MEKIKVYRPDCLVIGSGCAGFNAADCLYDRGMKNILLVTEGIKMGTSRNTGSDKQTYYKMALSFDCIDGVGKMAESYFAGQAMSGELALTESANSLACFYKLLAMGVPFPKNEYGEVVGYQTDHDETKRATSAGPLTSKYMTEALERSVMQKQIPILDKTAVFHLFVKNGKLCGALGVDRITNEFILFETRNIIMATGGSAALYRDSVFPSSQTGMTGMAIVAGAQTVNLTEWQYGLASVDFRWNVSGSYQQVLPRYVSIDENGVEREFLSEHLSIEDMLLYTFRKGYQWPFDSRKKDASSQIDLLVHSEILKGRKVYMDFMHNPMGYSLENLPKEAYDYLEKSGALGSTPIERLLEMNRKAYDLYLSHGIDLKTDYLRIAVCAQHQNGGLKIDKNYQTTIKGLYAAGEVAGVFGVYRPGGSALNSTQVSSMRAAHHVAESDVEMIPDLQKQAQDFINSFKFKELKNTAFSDIQRHLQGEMSDFAAFLRDEKKIRSLKVEVSDLLKDVFSTEIAKEQLYMFIKYRDFLITADEMLSALILWCEKIGARGGALTVDNEKLDVSGQMVCTQKGRAFLESPAPIPQSEVWFERVYNQK